MSAEPIRKEATGRYVVVVDIAVPGERRKQLKRRFTTYREARVWLGTTRAKVEAGSFVRPQRMTLAEWVDEWLPVLRTQVRRQTYESYERNLRLHVLPTLGARPMQSIKAAELTTLYARLLVSGRVDHRGGEGLSARSVAYLATILGKCLEAAVRGELIASNPARRAEVPKASASATRHEQMRTWTQQQLGHFLDVSRGHPHWVAWLLLATTGLRRGEALGLAWSSVDLEAGRLSVSRTLVDLDGDEPVWSDPKTARGRRSIALDPGTVAALRALRVAQAQERLLIGAGYVDHDLVFAHPDGRPLASGTLLAHVRRAGRSARPPRSLRPRPAALVGDIALWRRGCTRRLSRNAWVTRPSGSPSMSTATSCPSMETDAADRVAALILGSQS